MRNLTHAHFDPPVPPFPVPPFLRRPLLEHKVVLERELVADRVLRGGVSAENRSWQRDGYVVGGRYFGTQQATRVSSTGVINRWCG